MKLSPRGYELIKFFEGCSLTAYLCPAGHPTIGYGHRITGTDTAGLGRISERQAEELLTLDVAFAERCVNRLVTADLTQGQFDALVSFVFNLGPKHLAESTLLKQLNAGNYQLASAELLKWDHAGGKQVAGLTKRRQAELDLFEGMDWE